MSAKFIEIHCITNKNRTEEAQTAYIINTAHITAVSKAGQNANITLDSGAMIRTLESYDDIKRMFWDD